MTDLLTIGLLPVALTLATFLLGQKLQQKFRSPLLNPILISMILVLLFSLSSCASFEQPTAETSGEQSVLSAATSVSAEEPGAT